MELEALLPHTLELDLQNDDSALRSTSSYFGLSLSPIADDRQLRRFGPSFAVMVSRVEHRVPHEVLPNDDKSAELC